MTPSDVVRVYEKYIKGKNYVATSFVPKGQLTLALEGSKKAEVVEEKIVQGAEEEEVDPNASATYERTPSSFDRTVEPSCLGDRRAAWPRYRPQYDSLGHA